MSIPRKPRNWCPIISGLICLTFLCEYSALSAAGAAYLKFDEKWTEENGVKQRQQTILLSNGRVEFRLVYNVSLKPDTPKGRCFSRYWVYTIGMPTLGMTGPGPANWYAQGFFDLLIDGDGLKDYLAVIEPVRAGGPDAMFTATWKTGNGRVHAHFLLRAGDDRLLMRTEWETKAPAKTVELKLLNYPNYFYGEKDRWIATGVREAQHTKTVALDLKKEPWVFFQDTGKPSKGTFGASAIMFEPAEVNDASVEVTAYPIWTTLRLKPEAGKATIALWDFTGVGTNEKNLAYLREAGPLLSADLQELSLADWSKPIRKPASLHPGRDALLKNEGTFEVTPFDEMTNTLVTPHRPFAKPLAGGPLRVLVIAPRWTQRETVELAQRLDIDYQTVSVSKSDEMFDKRWMTLYGSYELYGYKPRTISAVLGNLFDKLSMDHDCIIVADVRKGIFPQYFIDVLGEKVRSGTGLITTGSANSIAWSLGKKDWKKSQFTAQVPLEALPALNEFAWTKKDGKRELTTALELDKGRVLIMNYRVASRGNNGLTPTTASTHETVPADYEYLQSILAKAVRWASRREPVISIEALDPSSLKVVSAETQSDVELTVTVHDREGRTEVKENRAVKLAKGANTIDLGIAPLRGGEHFLDVGLRTKGAVHDWASHRFETESSVSIESVVLKKPVLSPLDPIEGIVRLRGIETPARLRLKVTDSLGRLLADHEWTVAVGTEKHEFKLPLSAPVAVAHRLDATLSDKRGDLDWFREEFTVAGRQQDDFIFLVWSAATNHAVRRAILKELTKAGVDTIDLVGVHAVSGPEMGDRCRTAAWANLRPIPYITRIFSSQKTGLVRKPCLTDPEHLSSWTEGLRARANAAAPYSPHGYTLGDENFLVSAKLDVCRSATCLRGFREDLKRVYKTIGALNKEWETDYHAWTDANPITFEEAKNTNQFARWADHRRYMDQVLTSAHALGRQTIRQEDPDARVGFDGVFTLDSWHGYDFYQLVKACDLNQVYCRRLNQVEYLRSFAQPGAHLGAWHNRIGNADEVSAKRVAWHLLFHGFNSGWYWTSYSTGPATFFPDLRPTPQLKWMAESHNEIKSGIGKLIMNAERQHDGIAVHYSQASVHGNTLIGRKIWDAHRGAMFAIEDLGLQFNFVSYEEIENGDLKDYRAFVMPASCAVSPKELAAIRYFVRDGGLVIADVEPAVMDGRCKRLEKPALADLFGEALAFDVADKTPEKAAASFRFSTHDKGKTLLMNFPFAAYEPLRQFSKEAPIREALRKVFTDNNVETAVEVLSEGKPLEACEVVRFSKGNIEYVGIVKDDNINDRERRSAEIRLPRASHLYDARAKRYLGSINRLQTEIIPGVPQLYAMLPYRVESVELQPVAQQVKPGTHFEFSVRLNTGTKDLAGDHVIRLEVTDPKGRKLRHYAQNVLLTGPSTAARLSLALSDPEGDYTVTATEAVSGARAKSVVRFTR